MRPLAVVVPFCLFMAFVAGCMTTVDGPSPDEADPGHGTATIDAVETGTDISEGNDTADDQTSTPSHTETASPNGTGSNSTTETETQTEAQTATQSETETETQSPTETQSETESTTQTSGTESETTSGTQTETQTGAPEPETRLVEVSVWDLTTSSVYFPQDLEVTVADHGTWNPPLQPGGVAGPEPMGQHEVGILKEGGFTVSIGGFYGTTCTVDLMVTEEMVDERSEDITQFEVYNVDVYIFGPAIPGHPDLDTAYVCPR